MSLKLSDFKSVKKPRKIAVYKNSKFPSRQNPIFKLRLDDPIICIFCDKKQQDSTGRKKTWHKLNSLHGHCSYDHFNESFKPWLITLAEKIISGEMK